MRYNFSAESLPSPSFPMKAQPFASVLPCALCLLLAFAFAGCASAPSVPVRPSAAGNPNPPANVNLSGYPLEFRQGYADGCASVQRSMQRDEGRYKSDGQYRQGWEDGKAICRARN